MNNPDEIDINIDDINDTEGDIEEGNRTYNNTSKFLLHFVACNVFIMCL